VADDQVIAPGRGVAVQSLVDLAVGGINADLQALDEDAPPLRDRGDVRVRLGVEGGGGDVPEVDGVRSAGEDGDGFHRKLSGRDGEVGCRCCTADPEAERLQAGREGDYL
jgi:hypothetical protein